MQDNEILANLEHAMRELRSGFPVVVQDGDAQWLVYSAEAVAGFNADAVDARMDLLMPATDGQRDAIVSVRVDALQAKNFSLEDVVLAKGEAADWLMDMPVRKVVQAESAVLELTKFAALLPAVLIRVYATEDDNNVRVTVPVASVKNYQAALAKTLQPVSEAEIPLRGAEQTKVIAFRSRFSTAEHLAIVIGEPEKADAPLVRLHSSCMTGDVLGSLRCDCGDQLQEAIAQIAKEGSGVVLYLNQEGRGIGIANKLRAYQLQDTGLDTVEANEALGFAMDERQFAPAVAMLEALNIKTIRLLTNNPKKMEELTRLGMIIKERVALVIPANAHNARYLETKKNRCGHVI